MLKFFSHRRDEARRDEAPEETVVVPADVLIGWDEYRTRSMQREYRIIQLLKEHRRRSTHKRRAGSRASTSAVSHSEAPQAQPQAQSQQAQSQQAQDPPPSPDPATHGGMTITEGREAVVRERCEALRPEASWEEVAESLGISSKTLWDDRRKIFDSSHKFHPDQST